MAGMFAVYHGSEGIRRIANNAHGAAVQTAKALKELGFELASNLFFDTLLIAMPKEVCEKLKVVALQAGINFNYRDDGKVSLAFDELTTTEEVARVVQLFAAAIGKPTIPITTTDVNEPVAGFERTTEFMQEHVFNT